MPNIQTAQPNSQPLDVVNLPLSGLHVIDASAGTGKTFNITRLYLRLILEQSLSVQEILVVTFTKAATEELKGRIGKELREALLHWDVFAAPVGEGADHFYHTLYQRFDANEVKLRLKHALLNLDQASIFTIHGFCARVLGEHNVRCGLAFHLDMDTDGHEQKLNAVRDAYRALAADSSQHFNVLAEHYATPEKFTSTFYGAIDSNISVDYQTLDTLKTAFLEAKKCLQIQMQPHLAFACESLIEGHKQAEQRAVEFSEFEQWLADMRFIEKSDGVQMPVPWADGARKFWDGRRFVKAVKAQLNDIVQPLKAFDKQWLSTWLKKAEQAHLTPIIATMIDEVNVRLDKEKARAQVLDFSDLVLKLHHALTLNTHEVNELAALLAQQFPAMLIDEFQDTDKQQYQIFAAIYQAGKASEGQIVENKRLPPPLKIMIGDPKQAIYKFRGGDIYTYLAAQKQADYVWMMDTNWRSSKYMVQAYNRLFYGQAFEAASPNHAIGTTNRAMGVGYEWVKAGKEASLSLEDRFNQALCFVNFEPEGEDKLTARFRKNMAVQFADEIKRLLTNDVILVDTHEGQSVRNKVEAGDIAVLVRDRVEAAEMQQALSDIDLSSVYLSNRDNVFASIEARHWQLLLTALLDVNDTRALVSVLSTPLFSLPPLALKQLRDDEAFWALWRDKLVRLDEMWQQQGFISMAFYLLQTYTALHQTYKNRALTNYLQLLELIQIQAQSLDSRAHLLAWFEGQMKASDTANRDAELRLESDKELIQIITQHGSKGLEYPVVFVPFATRFKSPKGKPIIYQYFNQSEPLSNGQGEGELHWQLGDEEKSYQAYVQQTAEEDARLMYVAITRAVYRCYLGVAEFDHAHKSPLGLLLNAEDYSQMQSHIAQMHAQQPDDIAVISSEAFARREALSVDAQIDMFACDDVASAQIDESDETLSARIFQSDYDQRWSMLSFTGLTRLHHGHYSLQSELKEMDEPRIEDAQVNEQLRFTLTKGSKSGLALHELLEIMDFQSPDWEYLCDEMVKTSIIDTEQISEMVEWFKAVLACDMPLAHRSLKLSHLPTASTLREVQFYLPAGAFNQQALVDVLLAHRQRMGLDNGAEPLYLGNQRVHGMLNGIIDLVFECDGKYYISDYKSNHLGDHFEAYLPHHLNAAMQQHCYDLQALIYTLALHRYLKTRIDDYQPETHLGGSVYLFLRGMHADGHEGVLFNAPDFEALAALEALFSDDDLSPYSTEEHS